MTFPALSELLPHRPPMLLLDRIVAFDDESAACEVEIRESSTFFVAGCVPAWVALEYCAQTIAAYAGLKAHAGGGQPKIGLLVAARELRLYVAAFHAGDSLLIRVRREFGEERVGRFACEVLRESLLVASASLSVYLPGGGSPADLAQQL